MALRKKAVRAKGTFRITGREAQVLRYLAVGFTTEQISKRLKISLHTASCHRCNLIKSLGVHNAQQAVVKALRLGLVSRDFVVDAMVGE